MQVSKQADTKKASKKGINASPIHDKCFNKKPKKPIQTVRNLTENYFYILSHF